MEKLSSLQHVSASALPARVLVLMSKYARALELLSGKAIKLSSLRVFNDIHLSSIEANNESLNSIYQQLLTQVNNSIEAGLMITNEKKKLIVGENYNKQRILAKYLPQAKAVAA